VRYSRPTVYAYVLNFVSISLFCRPLAAKKNVNFVVFWTSAFCGVANWQQCEKVEHGCTLHNYRPSPIQRHQNRFCVPTPSWRNPGAQTLTFTSVTDGHTDRQKTQRFWPTRWRVKSEPHQTRHGDRGPRARSCEVAPLNFSGSNA